MKKLNLAKTAPRSVRKQSRSSIGVILWLEILPESRLVFERLRAGLLFPFICAGCSSIALDPVGYDGPGVLYCRRCADIRPQKSKGEFRP
jgi:hypothetical protein